MALVGVLLAMTGLASAARASTDRADLLRQAEQLERQGRWAEAADRYDQIPPRGRHAPEIRDRYLTCLRHVHQAQRHHDPTYRQLVQSLDLPGALRTYDEVLAKVQGTYVEQERADLARLFRQGLDELRLSLADEAFCRQHIPTALPEAVTAFGDRLGPHWGGLAIRSRREAGLRAREVALAAQQALGLRPSAAVLELACGACNGLDEYTSYLTPRELAEAYASFKGEVVGVGITELAADHGRLLIRTVVPGSPAAREGVQPGDRVQRIDHQPVEGLTPEVALERLQGEPGSGIEIVFVPAGGDARTLTLVREAVLLRSVSDPQLVEPGIGYLQVTGFQETTPLELERALTDLRLHGMRVLILDLRGNSGGVFDVAVQVAQRFLAAGVVVATQSPVAGQCRTYEAHTADPLAVPLVVLIDGDTASAAEVLAGALKENRRAILVGQPTYGKGSVQCVLRLDSAPAGIRLTLAKFFSPLGHPYQGQGVAPHVFVAQTSPGFDDQRQAAIQEARQQFASRR